MSKPSDFANANIDEIIEALSQDELISLIAGAGIWHTAAIPRLGVPALKMTGGSNGVRGGYFFHSTPVKVIPCATALGSTFDPKLIGQLASKLLAPEAKLRGTSIFLAPTVNIQRSPLGGRSFEAFSEDPFLSGTIASAYCNGLQDEGIGACIKHFVANDQEDDKHGVDTIISPRALREVYLMPFMIAEKLSKPWSYMMAYNKLNGLHCSENPFLIQDVLRNEWKSDAMVMSDWFGTYSVTESINAGLDLEMPGINKWRSAWQINWGLNARKTTLKTVKERARNVLKLVQKASKGAPDVLDGDGVERIYDSEEDAALLRSLAAQTIVLLKNQDNILPLSPESLTKVAIIGSNAKAPVLSGGDSASLKSSHFVNPYDGIVAGLKGSTKVLYAEGSQSFKTLPSLDYDIVNSKGGKGFDVAFYSHDSNNQPHLEPIKETEVDETYLFVADAAPKGISEKWTMKLKGYMKPREEDTLFEFGLSVAGRAKLYVDGELLIDNWTLQRRGASFMHLGTEEEKGRFMLKKGISHEILIEFGNARGPAVGDTDERVVVGPGGVRLGGAAVINPEAEIERAVKLAKEADVAIVVVGLNSDWETEGYDRTTLKLSGTTHELVRRVGQANPRTVVVTQSGSAIEMPWIDDVAAIAHSWYLGNATGQAISDVLFGKVNPSAKLSITFPKRLEDTPSYGHFGSENGSVRYAEDLFVGYKHYVHTGKPTLFPFGYGLSYTTFTFSDLAVSPPTGPELTFTAKVKVTNSGSRPGSEVVQIYVTPASTSKLTHPVRALRGYAKTKELAAGESSTVEIALDKYALSYWCAVENHWKIEKGTYGVIVGGGAEDVQLTAEVEVGKETYWSGL